ncbi:hypothetical protein N7537_008524 [Penicillium hordei]|uniref:Nephrocystin 3-like N-terminal domain-containing protein n=1 Tax=Penicillium hordei TaxID=40994 RepID=A0AAD6E0L5_9EURO|nr:uncharacterized protein N7537_008524 [Penicillium hordei]KAJ5598440.1 hypothetical protein N7537_008524 [Penicillium hordei]
MAPSPRNLERIKEVLQPSVYPLDMYQNIGKRRVSGTGDWIRNELVFQAWVEKDDNPLLHIDPETMKFHRALRDISFQVYQNDPSYRDYVHTRCHSPDDIKSIQAAWRVLFMDYYHNTLEDIDSKVIIVLDGIDEAFKEDYQEFLRLTSDFVHDPVKCRIKIVLLGRPEIYDDLMEALDQYVPTIHVNANKNIGDITTYVRKAIRKSRAISRVTKPQRVTIEKTLIDKAEGMFLWADLMLTELNGRTRASSMLESLHMAPKGLDAMLKHVLETFSTRLNEEEATDLNTILAWVACADSPVKLCELDEILRVGSKSNDGKLGLEDALRTQYASLFVLNRDDGLTTADLAGEGRKAFTQPENDGSAENDDSSSEQEHEFNSNTYTTTVVFCHASIRDYLRNPGYGKVSAGDDSTPIGVDFVQASVNTLNVCLSEIAYGHGPCGSHVRNYALDEWVNQLEHVCKYSDKIDQQQKEETIVLLCQIFKCANLEMFHTNAAPDPLIEFIDRHTIDLIVSLFAAQDGGNTVDNIDMREWIRVCIQEPAQLFVPLGREVASRWLVDSWDPDFCMVTVCAVVIVLGGDNPDLITPLDPVEAVLNVARWAKFEENARWHHNVGACLSSLGHFDAAIEHLNHALALEPTWDVKRDLAKVYWNQGQLDDSVQLWRECEAQYTQLLAENNNDDEIAELEKAEAQGRLSKVRNELGSLYIQLGDYSNATHWFMASIELFDMVYIDDAVSLVIRVLIASQHSPHERIIQLLQKIELKTWYDWDNCLFWVFEHNSQNWHIWDNTQLPLIFAVSAKRCNNLQWLECKYQGAIADKSTKKQDIKAMCFKESLACLYCNFLGEEEKAILIWKSIIAQHRVPGSLQYERFCRARNRAATAYAYRLLTNALRETEDSQALIVQELEKFCDNEIKSLSTDQILFDGQTGIYIGVWHKLNGREQEARNYFRPYVIQAISYRDKYIEDDVMSAWRVLGHLFAMIGDDEDAITVLQLVHSPFTIRDGTSASAEERMASPWPLVVEDRVWYCHICLQSWGNFVNCNICRRCNADICEQCLEGLKTGDAESYACDSSHEWLSIPPPPGVPGTYQLRRGNQSLSVKEYMASIERSWM